MKCGVRFCGGCNVLFDRAKLLDRIKEARPNIEFAHAEEGVEYDLVLVISGCPNHCTSFSQFTTKGGVVSIFEEKNIDKTLKEIDEIVDKLNKK